MASLALLTSCTTTEEARPELVAPSGLSLTLRQFTGSSLSGPLTAPASSTDASDALAVRVAVGLVKGPVDDLLLPIAPEARLVSSLLEGQPVAPAIRLARGARIERFTGETSLDTRLEGRTSVGLGKLSAALPGETTAAFDLEWRTGDGDLAADRPMRTTLEVFRAQDAKATDLVATVALEDTISGARRSESIVLGPLGARTLALLIPAPEEFGADLYLSWTLTSSAAPTPGSPGALVHANAVRRARAALEHAAEDALAGAARLTADAARQRDLELARRGLSRPGARRKSLVRIADSAGAPLATRLSIAVADTHIESFARAVEAALRGEDILVEPAAFAYSVERSAVAWAVETAATSIEGEPQIDALLLSRAGQVGADGTLLVELLDRARSLEELENRLVEENFLFLQDSAPAARARAFDWLASRGLAPEGFRPLGSTPERRAALARVTNAEAGSESGSEAAPDPESETASESTAEAGSKRGDLER